MAEMKQRTGIARGLLNWVGKTILAICLAVAGLLAIFLVIYTLSYPQPPSRMDVAALVGNSLFPMLLFGAYAAYSKRFPLKGRALAFLAVTVVYISALFVVYPLASYVTWVVTLIIIGDFLEAMVRRFPSRKLTLSRRG